MTNYLVPNESEFVELSRTKQGKLFKKHILTKGVLNYRKNNETKIIHIDDQFIDEMQRNFHSNVCPIVQIPVVDKNNEHTEDPFVNLGEVLDIQREGDKVYAILDVRKHAEDIGKTILGASATFADSYLDTKTGKMVGPTLLNVSPTNRPYLTDLEDNKEILLSSDSLKDTVVLTVDAEEVNMTKEELIARLKSEHGIDVDELISKADVVAQLSNALTQSGAVKLSADGSVESDKILLSIGELASQNIELTASNTALVDRVAKLEAKEVTAEVDELIREERVLPFQRQTLIDLKLSGNVGAFDALVSDSPIGHIKMSAELGTSESPERISSDQELEEARAAALALFSKGGK